MSELGQKIRELRKAKKMTLEELAISVGSSKSYIWEIENKEGVRPSAEKLFLIAQNLNTTLEYLLRVDANPEEAEDKEFFRKYKEMPLPTRKKLQRFLEILDDEDEKNDSDDDQE